ncbi:4Fe-4S cluster-binding domain-containing protein [Butyrivibrio sp. TB]|uniref:4Fe-4S cluster-binding domain-containing protein n=1 Tax=Butyrivibrio sp. TB TaxID=1520809 RepID=UPI0008B14B48|nr:4Fe-4S cluster-binding domain-containing protein [Butyrivibrio sp. TB]SEQ56506.1 anaerobic ribonucleoside-triphosphate reductase activating protein [Butyrivibrio sp. TB]
MKKKDASIWINVAGWLDMSCDDGPGIRSVLFLQGCSRNCPGCQNACTHDLHGGSFYELEKLVETIDIFCQTRMITISGGEPLEQPEGLKVLLLELKKRKFNICLYTGEQLEGIPSWVLENIDYLKVGNYIEQLHNSELQYYGSTNQKMYQISKGKVTSEIALIKEDERF